MRLLCIESLVNVEHPLMPCHGTAKLVQKPIHRIIATEPTTGDVSTKTPLLGVQASIDLDFYSIQTGCPANESLTHRGPAYSHEGPDFVGWCKTQRGGMAVSYTHLDVYKRQLLKLLGKSASRSPLGREARNHFILRFAESHQRYGCCLLYTSRCV